MRWIQVFSGVVCAILLAGPLSCPGTSGQDGITETVFNRRFIPTLKPGISYAQVVKLAGGAGARIGEAAKAPADFLEYRWKGGRNSALSAKFRNSKLIEALVRAPNGHTYKIQNDGRVVDAGARPPR